jgi:hypothetical protein
MLPAMFPSCSVAEAAALAKHRGVRLGQPHPQLNADRLLDDLKRLDLIWRRDDTFGQAEAVGEVLQIAVDVLGQLPLFGGLPVLGLRITLPDPARCFYETRSLVIERLSPLAALRVYCPPSH